VANVDLVRAWQLSEAGRDRDALTLAITAVAAIDAHRYTLVTARDRETWSMQSAYAYELAFELAERVGDSRLVAELVEAARVQAVPTDGADVHGAAALAGLLIEAARREPDDGEGPSGFRGDDVGPSAALIAAGVQPLAPTRGVRIRGANDVRGGLDPVDLEDVARALGGHGAWWWGSWVAGSTLWWAVVPPDGDVEAGAIDLDPGTAAAAALDLLDAALPIAHTSEDDYAFADRVRAGGLVDPVAERRLAVDLGRALIPPPLREVLRRAGGDPLPLVIAPAGRLGRVPFAALAVDDPEATSEPRRLVETAVIRLAPSVALLAAVRDDASSGRRGAAGPGPLLVGVFDPDEAHSLPQAAALGAALATAHPAMTRLQGGTATPSSLRTALARPEARPGDPGVLVYSGHAASPAPGVALLCLGRDGSGPDCPVGEQCCGGSALTSAALCREAWTVPGRVLLSACDTAGAGSSGAAGEWLGLGPALLWAGARCVVATAWPTLDHPNTGELDRELVRLLVEDADPATGLRAVQLERLERWRATPPGGDPVDDWGPIFWAGYLVVGFANG
jgi:hypothetical protein